MDITAYREQIIKPVSDSSPQGERLSDDPQLDFIESQMMKVGSLAHDEVEWEQVEQHALQLLSEKTKDLKVMTVLLQCLQHRKTPQAYIVSLQLAADFMLIYWDSAFPAPGDRGKMIRNKVLTQWAQRSCKAAEMLDDEQFSSVQSHSLLEAASLWGQVVSDLGLANESFDELSALLVRKQGAIQSRLALSQPESSVASQEQGLVPLSANTHSAVSATRAQSSGPGKAFDLDGSSDRAVKQSLLKVAEFLAELPGGMVMALRLRRLAVWQGISALPEANQKGETQLMPPSSDRVSDYREQLLTSPSNTLWHKIEQSLTVSPYWLDGHWLSYSVACKLGDQQCAEAIRDEAQAFIAKLPAVLDLTFKGGVAFACEETRQWLSSTKDVGHTQGHSGSWEEQRQEIDGVIEEQGLPAALALINSQLALANEVNEPRSHFYWQVLLADVLAANQLDVVARQSYQVLWGQMQHLAVKDWEPSLSRHLEKHVS